MSTYQIKRESIEGRLTYHLLDPSHKMDFSLVPDIGNFGYEFKVKGIDALIPAPSFRTYLDAHRTSCGNPFLAPWANRIDKDYYFFQGKKYLLNEALGNLRRDQFKQVIHGLLCFEPRWQVFKKGASPAAGAFVTSRLEFYKYPDLAAQFPFAQTYEVTHRLKDGKLEVTTKVSNVGRSPLPLMMAYHPYFRPDGPREEWTLSLQAKTHWLLNPQLVATGETEPAEKFLPQARNFTLGKTFLDDEFSGLERDARGRARISIKGRTQKVEVVYGPGYDVAVIYAPLDKELICIEPQTGPTNCFNLHHEGKYPGLIVLDAGKTFEASFWIIPTGY